MTEKQPDREQFPTTAPAAALEALRRPFSPDAIRFKIQNQDDSDNPSWAQVVSYVDARLVSERLNHVVGERWSAQIEALDAGIAAAERGTVRAVCKLCVLGVTRMDVGEGRDPKAAFSDALKRAAVHFGVGRSLYAMKPAFLSADGEGEDQLVRTRAGKLRIPAKAERWLRGQYEQWLAGRGAQFGAVLDHGDEPSGEAERAGRQEDVAAPATSGQVGHLHVVGDGRAAPTPAPRAQRDALSSLIAEAPYTDKTVRSLAAFVCDETAVDRLSGKQVSDLGRLVEASATAKVTDRRLTNAIARAKQFDDATVGRTELYEWLLGEAKKQQAKSEPGDEGAKAA